jgi:hypothetical protein
MAVANAKKIVRDLLASDTALLALVPASRIFSAWPDSFTTLPAISIQVVDSFVADISLWDNEVYSDSFIVKIDAWNKPGQSLTAIFDAVNRVLEDKLWNRDSYVELVEPETKLMRITATFSNVLLRV